MQKLFTSDLHLGHRAIVKYRDRFSSMEEHDDYIIDKILGLSKRTVLTILGDFLFDGPHFDSYIERLSKKKCRIEVVMGNHDSLRLYSPLNLHLEIQLPLYSCKNFWISHCPIHPNELRGRIGNIHGHLHKEIVTIEKYADIYGGIITEKKLIPDNRYFNVNIDVNDYEFVRFETIKERFNGILSC